MTSLQRSPLPPSSPAFTAVRILVGFGVFPLSLFGPTLVSFQHHWAIYLCKCVWKGCLILALNQNQYFNREKWYKPVKSGYPQTKLITLLQPSLPFPTHPRSPFLLLQLLSLNLLFPFPLLPGDSFPSLLKSAPAQQLPYCPCHPDI